MHILKKGTVNNGQGVSFHGPQSESLNEIKNQLGAAQTSEFEEPTNFYIIQEHLHAMTYNNSKMDTRMFWMVASVNPLVVLFHKGFVRISSEAYEEDDFGNPGAHLTNGARGGRKIQFENLDLDHYLQMNPELNENRIPKGMSARDHVMNQMKAALGHFVRAFGDTFFSTSSIEGFGTENGWLFAAADFLIDQNLDVWFIEPQYAPSLNVGDIGISLHLEKMYLAMINIVEEVQERQSQGKYVLPLSKIGEWEVVYSEEDGYLYQYDFYRKSL